MIWVFAEERSGSTWLCETLAKRLNKPLIYLEQYAPRQNYIHQTHDFSWLDRVEGTVLRTSRRDLVEHFLSMVILDKAKEVASDWYRIPHVYKEVEGEHLQVLKRVTQRVKVEVTKDDVVRYLDVKRERDRLWGIYGTGQVIYYEDLYAGVYIPLLADTLAFEDSSILVKLPYDKHELVPNWEQAVTWFKELT